MSFNCDTDQSARDKMMRFLFTLFFIVRHLRETLVKWATEAYRCSLDLELDALEARTATAQRLELRSTEDVVQRSHVAVK